ncbi:hypothetical protein TRFO_39126 [Tritrichomonas foetus]|uniref:Uncharacterized protein n=1 Tax=Tritrichomonas foetus TaxID=1144522 RepID=A0A1J4JB76_9EUKA|nr:hypothetical protein TRFO_39126 [Tritrichomonas foetus]|eukprot:OHS94685.1 hypothetical protein TRFO_39126 [Tritrichomonas foetus]
MKRFTQTAAQPLRKPEGPSLDKASKLPSLSKTQPNFVPVPRLRMTSIRTEQFGSFSPSWTIGSSRRPPKAPDETPGPSDYIPKNVNLRKSQEHQITKAFDRNYKTITSDIETPNLREIEENSPRNRRFRQYKSLRIGDRSDTFFYIPSDAPGTIYDTNRSTLSPVGYRIATRYRDPENTNPGPGAYSPRDVRPPKMATMARTKSREIFVPAEPDIPGPGAYDVSPPPRKGARWFKDRRTTREKEESDSEEDWK